MNQRRSTDVQKENSFVTSEISAAKLAVISSALITLADAVTTFAALLTLEGLTNNEYREQESSASLQKQLTAMQKQMDYLIRETAKKQ